MDGKIRSVIRMKNTIRIAGAQLPVSTDIQYNKNEIFKALDWAKENNVRHLVTPEGSLSGYSGEWVLKNDELMEALHEVENKQKKYEISLHLGTCIQNNERRGCINRNQIRHYNEYGRVYHETDKICVVGSDNSCLPGENLSKFKLPYRNDREFIVCAIICNDMWEWEGTNEINMKLADIHPDLILHSTNGVKHHIIDKNCSHVRDVFDSYHDAHLQMTAMMSASTILTVDSCVPWQWEPNEDTVNDCKTSSQSGVLDGLGWKVKADRYGRQYFYHDLDLNIKESNNEMINSFASNCFMENTKDGNF